MEVGIVGLDTLQVAVTYWEDAVLKMGYLDDNPLPAITVSSQKYIILPARITFSINLAFLYLVSGSKLEGDWGEILALME